MDEIEVNPIWSDSMGAKSMCVKVTTPETSILIDPAAAVMQKSYPLSTERKYALLDKARNKIEKASDEVDHIFISHYHYDHHFLEDATNLDFQTIFGEKEIWIKDPNEWINPSQWERSRKFLKDILDLCKKEQDLDQFEFEVEEKEYADPLEELPLLNQIDEGDYSERRSELHEKWREKFFRRADMWNNEKHIDEPLDTLHFADGKEFTEGKTKIRFTEPLFHGIEYSKTGWVSGLVVERGEEKFLYTSDIQGPTIEDYREWIIREEPDFLILDGPATYLLGYMLNKFNFQRSVKNAKEIIERCDFETMLYDHHLTREKDFREKTEDIWNVAEKTDKQVVTYQEYLKGEEPLVENLD